MAFGSVYVEEMKKIQTETPVRPRMSARKGQEAVCTLSILLVGRTGNGIRDYLCSMALNMDRTAGGAGLAFFTRDAQTIAGKIAAKKELETKLLERNASIVYEAEPEQRSYYYTLSFAGRQSVAVEFEIDCVTENGLSENLVSEKLYDAVWLLTDLPATEPDRVKVYAPADAWLRARQTAEGSMLCCVIMDCLEHLKESGRTFQTSKIRYSETVRTMSVKQSCLAYPSLRESSAFCEKLFLVQVYGGFAFSHWTEDGKMVLETTNGTCSSFLPYGCQNPLYETLEWARNSKKIEFFRAAEGNALWESIRTAFEQDAGSIPSSIALQGVTNIEE